MPLGIQRLNAKKSQPNDRIVFIKPLKGPDEAVAQDFLERIAAQCLPVMKEHHLSVMSLEEYEPNPEFVGRNFNAGEVIQLVLKARFTGRWLPFEYVQMVMMHELAHCRQMNHSKAFWAVRNQYAEQMRLLWLRGYTGDGIWGRGALLTTGEFEKNTVLPGETLPEHLCGGTYRSRGRKRKAKKTLTYQEQKERRILRKFGANGVALGEDNAEKVKLEKGRRVAAKPRVAGSKRGRELRAAAALARFEQQKKEVAEEDKVKDEDETVSGSETESGSDYEDESSGVAGEAAVDIDGTKMLDGKGYGLVKVCEDENPDDQDAAQELRELQTSMQRRQAKKPAANTPAEPTQGVQAAQEAKKASIVEKRTFPSKRTPTAPPEYDDHSTKTKPPSYKKPTPSPSSQDTSSARFCQVCSFANDRLSVTCAMCSNVLEPISVPNSWSCQSSTCRGSAFVNAGDCGVCNVCGQRKGSTS